MQESDSRTYIYQVDNDDVIISINRDCLDFARENSAGNINQTDIIGTCLWQFISDSETIHIYQTLLQKVRNGCFPLQISYRCDSPEKRRLMEMTITRCSNDTIEFQNQILTEETRKSIPLLNPDQPRNNALISMCGWCKKVKTNIGWLEIEDAILSLNLFEKEILPQISHGICSFCKTHLISSYYQ